MNGPKTLAPLRQRGNERPGQLDSLQALLLKQHYTLIKNYDATGATNNDPEYATAKKFKEALQGNRGILSFMGHATTNFLVVEAYRDAAPCQTAVANYLSNGTFRPGEIFCVPGLGIVMTAAAIKSYYRDNNTIVYLVACEAWAMRGSFTNARDVIGYDFCVPQTTANNDSNKFWGNMVGTLDSGNRRWISLATQPAAGFSFKWQHRADTIDTDLSPAIRTVSPAAGSSFRVIQTISGFAEFDTTMSTNPDPVGAIQVSGCNAVISNRHWAKGPDGSDRIAFDVQLRTTGTATVSVKWSKSISANNANQLDGNKTPSGTDHVGPNRDDYVWKFNCTNP